MRRLINTRLFSILNDENSNFNFSEQHLKEVYEDFVNSAMSLCSSAEKELAYFALHYTQLELNLFQNYLSTQGAEKNVLVPTLVQKCVYFTEISIQWIQQKVNQNSVTLSENKPTQTFCGKTYIWEGTISDLVELSIAINKAEIIRDSNGQLITYAEIIYTLQRVFGIKIPNIYSRKTRTMERKKNSAPFLERMLVLYKQEVEKINS